MAKKRPNECLFCTSRKCSNRVVSTDGGKTYNEVACSKHIDALWKHSDATAPGVMKCFISSTGVEDRRDPPIHTCYNRS